MLADVINWDDGTNLTNYSFDYWNDRSEESGKEWDISDGNNQKLIDYLNKSGLRHQYQIAESIIKDQWKMIVN